MNEKLNFDTTAVSGIQRLILTRKKQTVRVGSCLRFVSFRGSFYLRESARSKADPRNELEEVSMDRTIRKNSATTISLLGVVVFGTGWMQKQKEKRPMPEPVQVRFIIARQWVTQTSLRY